MTIRNILITLFIALFSTGCIPQPHKNFDTFKHSIKESDMKTTVVNANFKQVIKNIRSNTPRCLSSNQGYAPDTCKTNIHTANKFEFTCHYNDVAKNGKYYKVYIRIKKLSQNQISVSTYYWNLFHSGSLHELVMEWVTNIHQMCPSFSIL